MMRELKELAQVENTRAVFKRGVYEVLKVLAEAIEGIKKDFANDGTLKKSMVRNGWCCPRPALSKGAFVKATDEAWAAGLKAGSHRLRKSWVDKRYDNLDENGLPKRVEPIREKDKEEQGEASYRDDPGDVSALATWQAMVEHGEMTRPPSERFRSSPGLRWK